MLFKLLDASQRVIVVKKSKVLQRKLSEVILLLFIRMNWPIGTHSTSNARGPTTMLWFVPERSPQPRGVDLRVVFQVSQQESAISRGVGRISWLSSVSWSWSEGGIWSRVSSLD